MMINPPRLRARRAFSRIIMAGAFFVTTACASNAPQQTATSAHDEALSRLEGLRATATIARARARTTLDYAATRVAQADAAGTFLASNLINLGTDAAFIDDSLRQIEQLATQSADSAQTNPDAGRFAAQAPPATKPPVMIVTPPGHTPNPTSAGSEPRLESVSMASGVDAFDCAIDVNPRFTPASSEIYVVGRAFNIPAGATISSRWLRAGSEVVSFSFFRPHEIHDNCIWFFIDPTDTPFTAGAWSVELLVDGAPLASPVPFQIVAN